MKLIIVVSLALCTAFVALSHLPATAAQRPQTYPACDNFFRHEPLVVYEVTGGTLAGVVDGLLVVYNDGHARYSSNLGSGPGFSLTAGVGPVAARQLSADLVAAGALRQCDPTFVVNDVPLSTLTVLRGGTRQQGNTFSWFLPEGSIATMENRLSAFISATFPTLPAGGGDNF